MSPSRFACLLIVLLLHLFDSSCGAISLDPDCVIDCKSGEYADDGCTCTRCPDIHCSGTQALSEFDKAKCKNLKFVCPSMFKSFAETEASVTKSTSSAKLSSTSSTPTTTSPATMTTWIVFVCLVVVAVLLLLLILLAVCHILSRRPKPPGDDLEAQGQQPRSCWQRPLCCCQTEEKVEAAAMKTLLTKSDGEGIHPKHSEGEGASEQMLGSYSANLQSEPSSSENSDADSDAEDFNSQNPSISGEVQAAVHCDNCSADNADNTTMKQQRNEEPSTGNRNMEQQRNEEHRAGNRNMEQQRNEEPSTGNGSAPQMPDVPETQKVTCLETLNREPDKLAELKLKVEQTSDPKQPPETPNPPVNLPDQQQQQLHARV